MAFFGVTKASTRVRRPRRRGVRLLGDMECASDEEEDEDEDGGVD